MKTISQRIDDIFGENPRLPLLVRAVRREADLLSFTIIDQHKNGIVLADGMLMEMYARNKRLVSNIAVFQEFVKEVASMLCAKELVVDMVDAYQAIKEEDTKLECAMSMFQRQIP